MKTSQNGINLIKQFEGCRLTAYLCPAGVWTIGYGHTGNVKQGDKITSAQSEAMLIADLERFEKNVSKYASKYQWAQNEFDALVSFAYNIGSIDQLTASGTRSRRVIADKILEYNKANGQVLSGLTRRRQAERDLFLNKGDDIMETTSTTRATLKTGIIGSDVTYLQQRLTLKGYGVGAIDGIFGSKTLEAVKAFQAENNLTVDGIVGAKTWAALGSDSSTSNSDTVEIAAYYCSADGDMQISKNFKVREFRCKDGSDHILIDVNFVRNKLQAIRDHFGAPVTINSAYRTETYNAKVGGAKASYHMKGQAFDIVVKGRTPVEVAQYAQTLAIPGIIQYNTFVHVDSRPTKYWARDDNGNVTVKSGF